MTQRSERRRPRAATAAAASSREPNPLAVGRLLGVGARLRCDNGVMTESNVEIARRGFEAALHGDLDAVREFLDPDVEWHGGDPSAAGACHYRDQALAFMRQALSRRRIGELVDVVGAGDRVVVIMRPPSEGGEPAALSANVTTFRDGKAIEMVHYPNPADALAAAGV
jgi:ketosteroid isomerase-like protein